MERISTQSLGRSTLYSVSREMVVAFAVLGLTALHGHRLQAAPHAASHRASPRKSAEAKVRARAAQLEDNVYGGELRIIDEAGETVGVCPLKHTAVKADIAGFVARVNVQQQFANTSTRPVEAIYTFPLPDDAAVDAMTMTVGRDRIVGQIKRREQAKQVYEAAKAAGKTASLLNQERPNIFTQSVANIMPGETVTVDISYANTLVYDDGSFEWSFPTVVGPRYTPTGGYTVPGQRGEKSTPATDVSGESGGTEAVVTDADKITPPITPEGTRAGHDISLEVNIDAGMPIGAVTSRLHPVKVDKPDARHAHVVLADAATLPNKDFILQWKTAGRELQSGVLTHATKQGGYFSLVLQPPAVPDSEELKSRDIIFVIDQTGSQSGLPIRKAKEVMRYLIQNMNPDDGFQLLGFNTDVYPCFSGLVGNTPANVSKALKWLEPIEGGGGTDILRAAEYALNIPERPGRQRIICYLTDGYIGNEEQVIAKVKQDRNKAHLFTFGIGNSVNRMLIDGMAKAGEGTPEYVDLNKSGEEAGARFYRRIAKPLLTNIKVQWAGVDVSDVFPTPVPDLFMAGRPVIFKGRYAHGGKGTAVITGQMDGKPYRQEVALDLPAKKASGSALASIWAREKIAGLEDSDWQGVLSGNPNPDIKERIIQTALDYRLMTKYTSFVAVQQKIVNPGGAQETKDVPVEMAEGVEYGGIFGDEGSAEPAASATSTSRLVPASKAPRYAVASGGGFASRAGDPLIQVEASQNARQVVAVMPDGTVKNLKWNAASERWEARFDIPTYATEGDYRLAVIIVGEDGLRRQLALSYRVDSSGPRGAGAQFALDAQGRLKLQIEGSEDTERVAAVMPWGEKLSLDADGVAPSGAGSLFSAWAEVPEAYRSGTSKATQVTFILTDRAHNRTGVTLDLAK